MRLLTSAGFFLFLLWLALAILSNQAFLVPIYGVLAIQLTAWGIVIGLWFKYRGRDQNLSKMWILVLAVLMRLPSFYASPIYEDDYFRFLWDGWNSLTTGNPYNGPPVDYFDEPGYSESLQSVLYNVNYPEVPTIYAPICQAFFFLAALIEPLKLWSLRLVILLIELSVLFIFSRSANPRQLLLFAWCPLLIFESLFQLHPDFLAASFLFLAYHMRQRGSPLFTGIFCGLALGIKITVLPALAFLLWPLRKQALLAFTLTCVAMYTPFLLQSSSTDLDGLRVFATHWVYNASLYTLGASHFPPSTVKLWMLGIFTLSFFAFWITWQNRGALQDEIALYIVKVYGVLFLVSPVVNSWYILIILPFICISPKAWSLGAIVIIGLSYVRGQTLPNSLLEDFQQPGWSIIGQYAVVGILLICPWLYQKISKHNKLH